MTPVVPVLLLGGPASGKRMTVRRDVACRGVLVDVDDRPALVGDGHSDIHWKRVLYTPRELIFFGTLLQVHAPTAMTNEELTPLLAEHLLSEVAKTLIR